MPGTGWQLAYRRDLTSRLTLVAVCTGLAVTTALVARTAFDWDDMNTRGLYALGVLLGLVSTEQYLRRRAHDLRLGEGLQASSTP